MIYVIMKSVVKEGKLVEYKQLSAKMVEETKKEAGCVFYESCEAIDNPNSQTVIEKWESQEALDAHMKTAHFTEIVPKLRELRESSEMSKYKEA